MHNLYIMRLCSFQFISCKISVDAFSLIYSKLLLAKLCLFVFGDTFAASIGNLLAYVASLFVTSVCRLLTVRGSEDWA